MASARNPQLGLFSKNNRTRNRQKEKASRKVSTENKRVFLNSYKSALGCYFCTERDHRCLDFHHLIPEDKGFTISRAIEKRSFEVIQKEIEDCIVVCANCHRKYFPRKLRA